MADYYLGSTVLLYTNYTDGSAQPIHAGVSGVSVSVYHYVTGTKTFDLQTGTMTQDLGNLSTFYYNYTIPINAPLTSYVTQYDAMFSGTTIQSTDTFSVLTTSSAIPTGVGSVLVSGNVVDISGTGINNAYVAVSFLTGNTSILTSTVAISGIYTLQLDPNNYYITYAATGYNNNSITKTVPTGVTTFDFGNTTLVQVLNGSLIISDTYVQLGPDGTTQIPLSGMRVSLFEKGGAALNIANAIAISYTDISGTFTMSANPGKYALLVEGTQNDNRVYQTAYDIDISSVFTNSSSANFRYLGTSQYNFLI